MIERSETSRASPPEEVRGLGGGNLATRLAAGMLRWGHPRSPAPRTAAFIAVSLAWLVLGVIGWSQWRETPLGADTPGDFIYLSLWMLTAQGDVAGETLPLTLDLARWFGAAIPLLGVLFLAARQIGDTLALSLIQLWGAGHLVIVGEGRGAVEAAEAGRAEGAAVVLIDADIGEAEIEDLNQQGVLVVRDDLRASARKAALGRARRAVVVSTRPTVALSLARRAAEVMAPSADLHVQVEEPDILEMMRQSAARHAGDGPAPRPFSLAEAAARRAHEELRLWDRPGDGLHVAVLGAGPFSEGMARLALSLGWRVGRVPPRVTLWDPDGALRDRWSRMAPGVLVDLSAVYDSPPFRVDFSTAPSVGAFLTETEDATAWVVEEDVGQACAAALMASRLERGPVVVVSGERELELMLTGVETAVRGFAAGLEAAILPFTDRLAQQLHKAYEARGQEGYILVGSGDSGVKWSILPESMWAANRAAAGHVAVKVADADAAGADPREDRALLDRMAEVEHERWCAERLLNGWRPGPARDNARKLHPDLKGWSALDEPGRDKDRDGVIDAFRVARPRPRP
ncbi:RyR domain-containing protein [Brevundimonas sp.]|uniref:RyR domain-containing protein n=1 Tax=Brevundimonas sp. TaxID=1871086 RepID=UPI0025DE5338|nr:RyR domain-containing protein [Brevundimonas sp.]